ncbi:DUF2125 domain-containing protein [Sulfitobacter sabulilitoris]|uniref:DUF2125 domain-containing protein n=1 Tax=Sulfitobacter sabulilitoris TaxID=2562655 RepID=A0A5S3PED8_9RHOB|nr:DUF2125 domain-containing protein [Sulfitobacter sabulilitoris]TMM52405.1 DUF2125 domain-containing protein [Sulfitobacter sabulilitoris]
MARLPLIPTAHATGLMGLLTLAQPAFADVTAMDVWEDWRSYISGMAYDVSADTAMEGQTLTVSNLRIDMKMEEGAGTAAMDLGTVQFTENGDGTVSIALPDRMPIVVNMTPPNEDPVTITMDYGQTGFAMTASGTPSDMQYVYSADRLELALREIIADGEVMNPDDTAANMTLSGVAGRTQMTLGALRAYEQSMTAESLRYGMAFTDPKGEGSARISGGSEALAFTGAGEIPLQVVQADDMAAMLAAGFRFDGTFTYGAGNSNIAATSPDGPVAGTTTSQGGSLQIAMSQEGIAYDVAQTGLAVNLTSAAAPLPIAFEVADARFNISAPLRKSEEAQDFAFGFTLGDFTLSELIWGIFDPAAQLPRDPATIALDLTGKAKILMDLLDPANAARMQADDGLPGELEVLNINKLQVTAAGAELTGAGGFTFDNARPTGGMPKPTGAANFKLSGANALIDTLVAMGLLPQDQAMGARMMMGLFAVPGEAPDTVTSTIEINEEGHVLANGQRIQ